MTEMPPAWNQARALSDNLDRARRDLLELRLAAALFLDAVDNFPGVHAPLTAAGRAAAALRALLPEI